MGMFDDINYEMDCPKCGNKVNDFQSKDGACLMDRLEFWEVDYFYAYCKKCKACIEFIRKEPRLKVPISDYRMKIGMKNE